jgi:hypothetical protein
LLSAAEIRDAVQRQQLKDEALEEAAAAAVASRKQAAAAGAAAAEQGQQQQQQQQQAQGFVRPPPLGKPAAGRLLLGAFYLPDSVLQARSMRSCTWPAACSWHCYVICQIGCRRSLCYACDANMLLHLRIQGRAVVLCFSLRGALLTTFVLLLCAGVARLVGTGGAKWAAAEADSSLDAFLGKGSSGGSGSKAAGPFGGAAAKYHSLDAIEQMLFQSAPDDLAAAVKPKKKHKKKAKHQDA